MYCAEHDLPALVFGRVVLRLSPVDFGALTCLCQAADQALGPLPSERAPSPPAPTTFSLS
jgi:hypothetical protein